MSESDETDEFYSAYGELEYFSGDDSAKEANTPSPTPSEDEKISKSAAKTCVFLKEDLPTVDVEQEVQYVQESQGYTRTNSKSRLVYAYDPQDPPSDTKINQLKTALESKTADKDEPIASAAKPQVKTGNVADRKAVFESGKAPKDPALLSVSDLKALFEKNQGAALVPRAAFGMAPATKTSSTRMVSDKVETWGTTSSGMMSKKVENSSSSGMVSTKVETSSSNSSGMVSKKSSSALREGAAVAVVQQAGGIASKVAALMEGKSTISQEQIESGVKSERQKEMDMLLNRFNKSKAVVSEAILEESDDEEEEYEEADEKTAMINGSAAQIVSAGNKRKSAEKRRSSGKPQSKGDSPQVTSVLNEVKRIRVSAPKPGGLYPNLSDIEATTETETDNPRSPTPEESQSSSEDNNESDDPNTSFGRDILEAVCKNQTPHKRVAAKTCVFLKEDLPMVDVEQEVQYVQVSQVEFQLQQDKVTRIRSDLSKATKVHRTINMKHLPDEGESIINRRKTLEKMLMEEVKNLSLMKVTTDDRRGQNSQKNHRVSLSGDEIEATVQPIKTFGKHAMSTYNAQKAVTMDRLQQLLGSLETCPKESDIADDPKGLKVDLMPHQRRALAWLMWRETQKPSGGILADDMGLGKTLTMISLILKTKETEKDLDESSDEENEVVAGTSKKKRYNGGTLVVCPASLINQWSSELERHTKRGLASCGMYHGRRRETKPEKLAQYDMVVTTYSIVNNECEKEGAIFRVQWKRIVIDEAHQIRNHKSQTSYAVCRLNAKSRWALTGTPVHNKELDMYALLKFLRCTPFDDLAVWRRWVGDKSTGGNERLHTVISSLMMRRTKSELIESGSLNSICLKESGSSFQLNSLSLKELFIAKF